MNAIWTLRFNQLMWYLRLGPLREWREKRARRRETLRTFGVDDLVREVMDERYGKYGWRVTDDILEASVTERGGRAWWGPIGPLRSVNTRKWLTSAWMGFRMRNSPEPPEAPYKLEPPNYVPPGYPGYADTHPSGDTAFADTQPNEDKP